MDTLGFSKRGFNLDLINLHVSGGLVGQEGHQFFDQLLEGWRGGVFVPEHGDFMGDQGVVGNVYSHGDKSTVSGPKKDLPQLAVKRVKKLAISLQVL